MIEAVAAVRPHDEVVAVEAISKVFPGPPPITALRPCTFSIRRGEYVAVTGASGSGKTTLLSLLGLLEVQTTGHYMLNGIDVASLDDRSRSAVRARHIGFVFQAFHILGYRTVTANVELGLLYQGVPAEHRRSLTAAVLEQVGLSHRRHALCSTLSGGEKQRVAIARSLVRQPALMLCDEPTGNLDSATNRQIMSLLDALHRLGMTILIVTHDPYIASLAQRHFVISDGAVTESKVVNAPK